MIVPDWESEGLVDPRGTVPSDEKLVDKSVYTWPVEWSHLRVGLFSNRKAGADGLLAAVDYALREVDPRLSFVYASKLPQQPAADEEVIDSLRACDVVVYASAD
jgi:hypothetical protein